MTQPVPSAYATANALPYRTPVYALEIEGTDLIIATHELVWLSETSPIETSPPTVTVLPLMIPSPRGIQSQVDPVTGRSSIANISVVLLDYTSQITALIPTIGGKKATLKAGFIDIVYNDFITLHVGIIEDYRLTPDFTGYELTIRDLTSLANQRLFDMSSTTLSYLISKSSTEAIVEDHSNFQDSGTVLINNELIAYTAKFEGAPTPLPQAGSPPVPAYEDIAINTAGTLWCAVAQGYIYLSSNGTHWWEAANYPNLSYISVAEANGIWIAVTLGGDIVYSADGDNWSVIQVMGIGLRKVRSSPRLNVFITIGFDFVARSIGGTGWSEHDLPVVGLSWRDICFTEEDEEVVAYLCADAGAGNRIAYSNDGGFTWAAVAMGSGSHKEWRVAIATNGGAAFFADTTSDWADVAGAGPATLQTPTGFTHPWRSGCRSTTGQGPYILVASDGAVLLGTSGFWALQTPLSSSVWSGIAVTPAHDFLVVVSRGGPDPMMVSNNSTTWTDTSGYSYKMLTGLTRAESLRGMDLAASIHNPDVAVREYVHLGPAHPMDVLKGIYENSGKVGLDIDPANVDEAQLTAIKTAMGSVQMEWGIAGPVNAKTWLETEIYGNTGTYPVIRAGGKLSLKLMTDPINASPAVSPDASLDEDEIVVDTNGVPKIEWYGNFAQSIINRVTFQYNWDFITGKYTATRTRSNTASIAKYGLKPLIITSAGWHSELSGTDEFLDALGDLITSRYGDTAPLVRVSVFLSRHLIEAGDTLSVTSRLLPNPDGTRGVVDELMEVVSRGIATDEGIVNMDLLDIGWGTGL